MISSRYLDTPVDYNEAEHRYSSRGRRYTSATQIVDQFRRPFDKIERSQYMAKRYGQTPEYWLAKWKSKNGASLLRGNNIHKQQEDSMYRQRFVNYNPFPLPVLRYKSNIPYINQPDGVYPEMLLWRHDYHIAGRSDKVTLRTIDSPEQWGNGVETSSRIRVADVSDFKTNEKIRMRGYQQYDGTIEKMCAPLDHLEQCEFNDYALQLSLYQFMLEWFGFFPGERTIIHFPHEIEGLGTPKPVTHRLPYLRDEVISMLKHLNLKAA